MIKCEICGYIANSQLTTHLKREHNICSKEYKEKYNAQVLSPEALNRLLERNKSEKQRNIISERNRDPEFIKKCKEGINNSETFKKAIGDTLRKRNKETWADPVKSEELRKKMSASAKVRANSEECIMNWKKRVQEFWADPDRSQRMLNGPKKSRGDAQHYYSEYFQKQFYCRSAGELDFIKAMEFIKAESLESEPLRINKIGGGIYIPDFVVIMNGIRYIVEIKFSESPDCHKIKVESALEFCSQNNYKFCWIRRFEELPQIYNHKSLEFCVISCH